MNCTVDCRVFGPTEFTLTWKHVSLWRDSPSTNGVPYSTTTTVRVFVSTAVGLVCGPEDTFTHLSTYHAEGRVDPRRRRPEVVGAVRQRNDVATGTSPPLRRVGDSSTVRRRERSQTARYLRCSLSPSCCSRCFPLPLPFRALWGSCLFFLCFSFEYSYV